MTALELPTADGKALLRGELREVPGAPLVIFVHGLNSGMWGELPMMFSRVLSENGYASIRFNLYGYQDDERNLVDITLAEHAADLDTVIEFVQEEHRNRPIFVIGHSLGGLTILVRGDDDLAGSVLWDPSGNGWATGEHPEKREWVESLDAYRLRFGVDTLIGRRMLEHAQTLEPFELASRMRNPLLIVSAGRGILGADGERYLREAKGPKERVVLESAQHSFTNEDSPELLFEVTLAWLNRTSRG